MTHQRQVEPNLARADNGKLKLIAFGILVCGFAYWTLFLISVALLRQFGGPHRLLAALLLWPLMELIWTWIWAAYHRKHLVKIDHGRRRRGQALVAVALFLPPPLYLILASTDSVSGWAAFTIMIGTTVVSCWAARIGWSRSLKNIPVSIRTTL